MTNMDDFLKQAKGRHDELCSHEESLKKQISETQSEKRALRVYLIETGVIAKPARKRKKRVPPAGAQT